MKIAAEMRFEVRNIVIIVFIFVTSLLMVPGVDSIRFYIPSYSELQKTEGIVFFDEAKEYKRGLPLGVRVDEVNMLFTCRVISSSDQDCVQRDDRRRLAGKHVTILWSEQPIFLWMKEKRAFQISIEGVLYLSYDELVAKYRTQKNDWLSIGMMVFASMLLIFFAAFFIFNELNKGDK